MYCIQEAPEYANIVRISLFLPDLGVAMGLEMGVAMGVTGDSVSFDFAIDFEHFPMAEMCLSLEGFVTL